MARPKSPELTERELEVMHVLWDAQESLTVAQVRDLLEQTGRVLAYTTVATLVRILVEKGYLRQINDQRPFNYRPLRSFEDVSRRLVRDLVQRVFQGSREQLLVRLLDTKQLTAKERQVLQNVLKERKP